MALDPTSDKAAADATKLQADAVIKAAADATKLQADAVIKAAIIAGIFTLLDISLTLVGQRLLGLTPTTSGSVAPEARFLFREEAVPVDGPASDRSLPADATFFFSGDQFTYEGRTCGSPEGTDLA